MSQGSFTDSPADAPASGEPAIHDAPEPVPPSAVNAAVTGRTLPPPELSRRGSPASVGEVFSSTPRGTTSIARRLGRDKAELADLAARVRDAAAAEDRAQERVASATLARALAARGAELDRAARLARRSLSIGDDPTLRSDLAGWLSSLGEPALAAATLRGVVATAPGEVEKARTLLRIAVLLARAGDAEGAVDALAEAAEHDPEDPMPRELFGAIASWAEDSVDRADAARAFLDAADLRAERGEEDAAFEDRLRAFELAPELADVASAVADDLVHSGRAAAADEIRRLSARGAPAAEAASIHLVRMRGALEDGDVARALGAMLDGGFESVDDPAIAPSVDDLLKRAGLEEVVAVRLARRARGGPPLEQLDALLALARLTSTSLSLPEVALEAWLGAFSLDPGNEAAKGALRDRFQRAGDVEPLVEGLVRVALREHPTVADSARTAARELAVVAEDTLGDPALASWALRRMGELGAKVPAEVLARLAPGVARHAAELETASRELAKGGNRLDALRTSASRLRSRPDARDHLIEALAALVRASPEDSLGPLRLLERVMARPQPAPSPTEIDLFESVLRDRLGSPLPRGEAVRVRALLGAILDERGDAEGAALELAPLLEEAPGHPLGAAWVLLAATRAGRPGDRGLALAQLAEPQPPAIRAALLAVASEQLLLAGDAERARDEARRAAEADPSSVRAASALASVAGRDRDQFAAQILEQRMGVVVPHSLLCAQLADALEELGEEPLALAWTQRWVALAPGDRLAAGELLRRSTLVRSADHLDAAIGRVMGRPAPLGELAIPLADALVALGEVDAARGRAAARRALDVFGPRVAPVREAALAMATRDADHELGAAALERWYASDPSVGAQVLFDLSRRRADGGDLSGAARDLRRAAEADGDPETVLSAATVLEARAARAEEERRAGLTSDGEVALADATSRALVASGVRDGVLVARALRNLGGALWDLAHDFRGAEQAFFSATTHLPRHGLERYARDLWEFAGPEDACRAIEERASIADPDDVHARAALLALLAMLCADSGRFAEALPFALTAIDIDPSQAQAVATVERCAHVDGGLEALDAAYSRLARAAMGKYGRRAAHYRAARQLERRGASEAALPHAIAAFESVPEEGSTYVLLARLAETTGRAAQITGVLERVAESARAGERAGWLQKAASLQDHSLEGARARFDLLLRALHITIDAEVLTGIGAAARELVDGGEPLDLVSLRFERAVSAALPRLEGEPGARAALVIAETALASLAAGRLAAEALRKAIVLGPEVPLFDSVVPHSAAIAADPAAARGLIADVMRAVVESEDDDGFAATLPPGPALLRLGLAIAHDLGDDVAQSRLGAALARSEAQRTPVPTEGPDDEDPGEVISDAPPSLSRPMSSHGAWLVDPSLSADGESSSGQASVPPAAPSPSPPPPPPPMARSSPPAGGSMRPTTTSHRPGSSVRSGLQLRPSSAPPRARPPSEAPPLSPEAASMSLEQLEREAQQRGDHDAVAVFLARRISAADSAETRRLLRLRRAAVLEQRLGRPEDACRELERLVAEFPDDRSALPFLADLYVRLGDDARAAPLWDRMAARTGATDDERTEYGVRSVRAYLEAGNTIAAREAFARAASGAPGEIVAELRAEIARASGDHAGIVDSLDALIASGAVEEPERLATLLVEASRAAAASGDLSGALARARKAAKLDPDSSDAVLEAIRLDYRLRGGGTPREAQATIDDLNRVAEALRPEQVELHAFLLAEMLDVVQGGGAGMRELTARHAEIGSAPLLALGMAERLVRAKSYSSAVPLFQKALEGDFAGLRARTRVLLAAADAAAHAGDATLALRLAEEAESQPDGKALAHRKRLEIVARHGARAEAITAAEELAAGATGSMKARALGLLARLFVDEDPERAETLYADAITHAKGDRPLVSRLSEELEALRQGEPPPPSVMPVPSSDLHSDLAAIAAATSAADRLAQEARAAEPATRPVGVSIAEAAAAAAAAAAPEPPAEAPPDDDLDLVLDLEVPSSALRHPAVEVVAADPRTPAPPDDDGPPEEDLEPGGAGGREEMVSESDLIVEPAPSSGPISSVPPSRAIPPPPTSSRINAAGPGEQMFVERLQAGDTIAGDELVSGWGPDALTQRPHDVLAVRRRQLALACHRLELVRAAHQAALADSNMVYARALEHVLAVAGSAPRGGLPAIEPVLPPPPAGHDLAPEMVHALLFKDLVPPVLELLALVWETGILRKDQASYGLTGNERVSLGSPTPIARLLASLAPLFGQARPAHFLPGPEPPRVRPALVAQPAILVTGDPHDEDLHLVFQIGACWAATMPEYTIVLGAPEFQVRQLLLAVQAAFGPVGDRPADSTSPSSSDVTKVAADLYQRVLPRTEKRLRAICEQRPDLGYETARDVARYAARRAGLLACGDLSTGLAFVAADLGLDLAHASTPEGFEHACANLPEVTDLVRLATRMEYAQARWPETARSGR